MDRHLKEGHVEPFATILSYGVQRLNKRYQINEFIDELESFRLGGKLLKQHVVILKKGLNSQNKGLDGGKNLIQSFKSLDMGSRETPLRCRRTSVVFISVDIDAQEMIHLIIPIAQSPPQDVVIVLKRVDNLVYWYVHPVCTAVLLRLNVNQKILLLITKVRLI